MLQFQMPSIVNIGKTMEANSKFGAKKLVVITGTSSGLGKMTARALLRTGQYHVVGGVRDLDKMEAVAEVEEFDMDCFTPMELDLNSFSSVRAIAHPTPTFLSPSPAHLQW
jgi:NADP-dependent 3-hydroxy acid dehydrogenase YdfG